MGRYDDMRERLRACVTRPAPGPEPPSRPAPASLDDWDPFATPYPEVPVPPKPEPLYMAHAKDETPRDRKLRMLRPVRDACLACTMCELGHRYAKKDYMDRDPHCFSNLNPTRFMVVGQNPGWNELREGTPFVGPAGENFDRELCRHGLSREEFYICNANRCWTEENAPPTDRQRRRCEPFLAIEINLLKPRLVVALGASAFGALCPGEEFRDGLGKITRSARYEVPVFGVYHPSPRNLEEGGREAAFRRQMRLLCRLIIALRKS